MKAYLEIKKQPLPNYKSDSLFKTLKSSAREHGYKSFLWYGLIRFKDHFLNFGSRTIPWNNLRIKMQRWRGVNIGKNVHWGTDITIDPPYPYFLTVEDGVSLAGNNYVLTHNKPLDFHKVCSESYVAPVVIRKNAWIAVNVTILPGVEIGEGSIVAAGSVVTKDIPPLVMAAGIPAKVIKDMAEQLRSNYSTQEFDNLLEYRKNRYNI